MEKDEAKTNEMTGEAMSAYLKFALMMMISFVIMYGVMYLNVDRFEHVYLSLTRLYMTLLMVAPMAVVMLGFMRGMYKDKRLNAIIVGASLVVFVLALVFLRNQTFIGERQYMKAMIPHHSSAILTSKNSDLQNPPVRTLSKDIIEAQEREIREMKDLLDKTE
jgi:hypothetical protein